jgi:3-oxo-5alpha-steroid 4-dehydrogenase
VSSGIHGDGYISGTSLGDGTFFGRRAGAAAAQDIVAQDTVAGDTA